MLTPSAMQQPGGLRRWETLSGQTTPRGVGTPLALTKTRLPYLVSRNGDAVLSYKPMLWSRGLQRHQHHPPCILIPHVDACAIDTLEATPQLALWRWCWPAGTLLALRFYCPLVKCPLVVFRSPSQINNQVAALSATSSSSGSGRELPSRRPSVPSMSRRVLTRAMVHDRSVSLQYDFPSTEKQVSTLHSQNHSLFPVPGRYDFLVIYYRMRP